MSNLDRLHIHVNRYNASLQHNGFRCYNTIAPLVFAQASDLPFSEALKIYERLPHVDDNGDGIPDVWNGSHCLGMSLKLAADLGVGNAISAGYVDASGTPHVHYAYHAEEHYYYDPSKVFYYLIHKDAGGDGVMTSVVAPLGMPTDDLVTDVGDDEQVTLSYNNMTISYNCVEIVDCGLLEETTKHVWGLSVNRHKSVFVAVLRDVQGKVTKKLSLKMSKKSRWLAIRVDKDSERGEEIILDETIPHDHALELLSSFLSPKLASHLLECRTTRYNDLRQFVGACLAS